MKTFTEFCQRYELDRDANDAKKQFAEYQKQANIFGAIEQKNKGGRPIKPESERKSKVVQVRFTQDDFLFVEQVALNAGFKNISHFIRSNVISWSQNQSVASNQ